MDEQDSTPSGFLRLSAPWLKAGAAVFGVAIYAMHRFSAAVHWKDVNQDLSNRSWSSMSR
ncbi:MAG: hypothetical protein WAU86_09805 [Oricola sp.]